MTSDHWCMCVSLHLLHNGSWLSSALISITHPCDPCSFPASRQILVPCQHQCLIGSNGWDGPVHLSIISWQFKIDLRVPWKFSICVHGILCWTPHFWTSQCHGSLCSGRCGYIFLLLSRMEGDRAIACLNSFLLTLSLPNLSCLTTGLEGRKVCGIVAFLRLRLYSRKKNILNKEYSKGTGLAFGFL